ncbi:hypothetical protein VNI00_019004 [Paramarasmius palmivorus]|uniref:Uncharacterized protein n=1 Tax=Paramarasmius palmivorus TaxID=297713 RepID=A0AAW0ARZ9_9AGAR
MPAPNNSWNIDLLCDAASITTACPPQIPVLSCTPKVFDYPSLPLKADKSNYFVFMVYCTVGGRPATHGYQEGIYRDFSEITCQLPGGQAQPGTVMYHGFPTLDGAKKFWEEKCHAVHNCQQHLSNLRRQASEEGKTIAFQAKADMVSREIASLYPPVVVPEPPTSSNPPRGVLRPGRAPPPSPARRRGTPVSPPPVEEPMPTAWKFYVATDDGLVVHADLKSAWYAVKALEGQDVALFLAQNEEDADRYWDELSLSADMEQATI